MHRLVLLLGAFAVASTATAEDKPKTCWDAAMTQSAMNQCAGADWEQANSRMEAALATIGELYADDPKFLEKLQLSQSAWVVFRDAELAAIFPHAEKPRYYGSVYPMCRAQWLAILTHERVRQLNHWIEGTEQGDVCSGSIRVRKESN